jgi:hypothetical protein
VSNLSLRPLATLTVFWVASIVTLVYLANLAYYLVVGPYDFYLFGSRMYLENFEKPGYILSAAFIATLLAAPKGLCASALGWICAGFQFVLLDTTLAVLGLAFTAYFLYAWLFFPSWVHVEFYQTAHGHLLRPGQGFFSNLLEDVFNLNIGEGGLYRPRALSFFIQYLDTNLSFQFYRAYPQLGVKLPSYALSIIATVASFVWFWRSLFPKSGYGVALIGGASLLYYDVYINTSFMALRGGKFLAAATGIFCITIFIRRHQRDFALSRLGLCFGISFLLFLLATLDEQVVALIIAIAVATMIIGLAEKRVSQATVIFALSAVIYCVYYLFIGRWIFDKFTPGGISLSPHYHQFSDVFKVNPVVVFHAAELLLSNFIALGISSALFLGVFVVSFAQAYRQGKCSPTQYMILSGFVAFPLILTSALVASHPPLYTMPELRYLFYLSLPVYIMFIVAPYSVYMADSKTDFPKKALAAAFIVICVSGIHKINILYRMSCGNYYKTHGGTDCGDSSVFTYHIKNINAILKMNGDVWAKVSPGERPVVYVGNGILVPDVQVTLFLNRDVSPASAERFFTFDRMNDEKTSRIDLAVQDISGALKAFSVAVGELGSMIPKNASVAASFRPDTDLLRVSAPGITHRSAPTPYESLTAVGYKVSRFNTDSEPMVTPKAEFVALDTGDPRYINDHQREYSDWQLKYMLMGRDYGLVYERGGVYLFQRGAGKAKDNLVFQTMFTPGSAVWLPNSVGGIIFDSSARYGKARVALPTDHEGFLAYGHYMNLPAGDYVAVFRIKALDSVSAPFCRVDVRSDGFDPLVAKTIGAGDVKQGEWAEISVPFTIGPKGTTQVEPRVFYMGKVGMKLDTMHIKMGDAAFASFLR